MQDGMSLVLPLSSPRILPSGPLSHIGVGAAMQRANAITTALGDFSAAGDGKRLRDVSRDFFDRNGLEIPWRVDIADPTYSLLHYPKTSSEEGEEEVAATTSGAARNQISFVSARFVVAFVDGSNFQHEEEVVGKKYSHSTTTGSVNGIYSSATTEPDVFLQDVARAASAAATQKVRESKFAHTIPGAGVPAVAYFMASIIIPIHMHILSISDYQLHQLVVFAYFYRKYADMSIGINYMQSPEPDMNWNYWNEYELYNEIETNMMNYI